MGSVSEERRELVEEAPECSALSVEEVSVSNAHSLRTSREPHKDQEQISDFKETYTLAKNSFELPGLGESGDLCMSLRASAFAKDGSAVKYERHKCRRVECPNCWTDWARRRVFEMALRIEAMARWDPPGDWVSRLAVDSGLLRAGESGRPHFAVLSVPPSEAKTWTWERLNESLFRRGYRRLSNVGVVGGYALLHPYRLNERAKSELQNDGWGSGGRDAGYWKGVREDALNWGSWRSYCKFGPHLHTVVFGEPEPHSGEDYIIRFKGSGEPEPMSLERIVGYLFYVITHTGVGANFHSRSTRSFGELYNLDPEELLGEDEFEELADEIADRIGMIWEDGELSYEDDADEDYDWVSIFKLEDYMYDEEWVNSLPQDSFEFLDWLLDYFKRACGYTPPPWEDEELRETHEWFNMKAVFEVSPEDSIEDLSNELMEVN